MADCGATGSALDRSAARLISSAIGNTANGQSATRAGKAIASFLGNAATTGSSHVQGQGSLIPSSVPTLIANPMNQTMEARNRGLGHPQTQPMANAQTQQPIIMNQRPLNMPMEGQLNYHQLHPNFHAQAQAQVQAQAHMHANMQMQMQMNMMQQQMNMMNIAQQQKQQESMANQRLEEYQSQEQHISEKEAEVVGQTEAALEEQDLNDWHNGLEDQFQNYLNSYKADIQADAASTHDPGHEGNVEGANIERLAAAWEEAEREFSTDDYANLASNYDYEDEGAHRHYEFSQGSELYGQRESMAQADVQNEDRFIDLMSKGMKHFEDGETSEAVLCFESELRNVDGDNADAWLMLGKCHAENDEDRKAIVCLENAVERDPYSSEALLALGVSYVNELDHERALKHLNNWVTHNPNYAGLKVSEGVHSGEEGALNKLKSLLNEAKQFDESNGNMENSVDVLEALGVVCNVTREYDEAAAHFRAAARMRPNDYQLFNKLGATLANSSHSDEAQDAYQSALSIKPKYARAWLNLAISHSNLQNHDEAARCYLQTMSLNPGAVHVWSYLRIALTCSEKWDLLPLAAAQDLNAFKEHFDFVQYK